MFYKASIQCKSLVKELSFVFFCKRKGTQIVLWTEWQEQELETLYEEYKDSEGTGDYIM